MECPCRDRIQVRGARVHNLRDVDVDIPLGRVVGIAGVSGSGKSSLALGVLYAEGSRRYLEALSTYTRRRLTQATETDVVSVENVPAALALHQRPAVPGIRSTFGTMTELLNPVRLMFSRLGSYTCPNGHRVPPSTDVAADRPLVCRECSASFMGLAAERFAFNGAGACGRCSGTGIVREIDDAKLVPNRSLTLREGAVTSWNQMGIQWMYLAAGELGVRVDVPFDDLTPEEVGIVMDGPEVQVMTPIVSSNGKLFDLNVKYRNARRAVEEGLNGAKTEKAIERVDRFLTLRPCDECSGSRLNAAARSVTLADLTLPEVCAMTLSELVEWMSALPDSLPDAVRALSVPLTSEFLRNTRRLMQLGLGYLSLDRAGSTLSTGERQRVQLARSVRSRLTGALYVLDEPSIGLHPSNVEGLLGVVRDLADGGNTVVLVDHDTDVLRACDMLVEMGPGAGNDGGNIVSQGSVEDIEGDVESVIGPFLSGSAEVIVRDRVPEADVFSKGSIRMTATGIHTVKAMTVDLPLGRLTVVTGVSGSGKTTMVLEGLVPSLGSLSSDGPMPDHVVSIDAPGIRRVELIDATPIGANVRSTVSTYCGVLNDLRNMFSKTDDARGMGLNAKDLSYNTGSLRCPGCDGTGQITMDVQFLPDISMVCPDCGGSRYSEAADRVGWTSGTGERLTLPDLMSMTIDRATDVLEGTPCHRKLRTLCDLGLGYLTLGESTPSLSGGEAQRLKLASEMGRKQADTVFVFDEPTIGLHPKDVRTLIGVFDALLSSGATVIVIEHDLDVIANADHVIDMGPGGGDEGGTVVACGTPEVIASTDCPTGRHLASHLGMWRTTVDGE